MSAGTNAFGAKAGFNQSGGAYFMCLANLEASAGTAVFVNTISAVGSNSGGAWIAPNLALTPMSNVLGTGAGIAQANAAALVDRGKMLKDMGRTVVSAGRTFRKFAPVVSGVAASTFGVVGAAGTTTNAGYGAFYLEVGREGAGVAANSPAPIARYF
jgi:hypothetical protein